MIVTVGYKEVFRRQTVTTLQYIKTKQYNDIHLKKIIMTNSEIQSKYLPKTVENVRYSTCIRVLYLPKGARIVALTVCYSTGNTHQCCYMLHLVMSSRIKGHLGLKYVIRLK